MTTRISFVAMFVVAGCGARSAPDVVPVSNGGSSTTSTSDGGTTDDAGDAGDADATGGPYGQAPVPTCKGSNAQCVSNGDGTYSGASIITCDGVYFVGPWTLLLERQINTQFKVIQTQVVQEPGFGAKFDDKTGPPAQLTYRVCVLDSKGTRCGVPFTTDGPVSCACVPFTCELLTACNVTISDGCGGKHHCGGCFDGTPCNTHTSSCCPQGDEADGAGGCECAPPKPCPGSSFWNAVLCSCDAN